MKIAVPVKENYEIDSHFGHCDFYQLFTITENNEILYIETTDAPEGCGCKSNMAEELERRGVRFLLAGGIGTGAINKLAAHNIQVIRNCEGNATEQVKRFLAGELKDGGATCTSHEHGHDCGEQH